MLTKLQLILFLQRCACNETYTFFILNCKLYRLMTHISVVSHSKCFAFRIWRTHEFCQYVPRSFFLLIVEITLWNNIIWNWALILEIWVHIIVFCFFSRRYPLELNCLHMFIIVYYIYHFIPEFNTRWLFVS